MDKIQAVIYFGLALACAVLFALLEIQIEGKDGWAGKLPTWKVRSPLIRYALGGTDMVTGYHVYLWAFLLAFSHIVFIAAPWSPKTEVWVLSFVAAVIYLEDFLWFALNPHFGISRFNRVSIPWHKRWLGPLPIQYYTGFIVWLILFWVGK